MKLSDLLNELEEEESNSSNEQSINYKMLFFKYFSKWYWFAAGVFICLSIAVVYTYFSTPQYLITSKLLLKDEKKGADFTSNAVVSDMLGFGSSSSVENEAEVLKAENLMVKVFKELNISNGYFIQNGKFRYKEIYGTEVPIQVVIHRKNEYYEVEDNSVLIHIKNQDEFELETPGGTKKTDTFGQKLVNF